MLSSPLSHDEQDELLRGAHANVGLLADDIWAPKSNDDSYRRLNRALWIRSRKIAANYAELSTGGRPKKKRVRDVIPESRLANYGDFEYEDDDELLLLLQITPTLSHDGSKKDEKTMANGDAAKSKVDGDDDDDDEVAVREPWMLDEVEEYFARITAVKRSRPGHEPSMKSDETSKDSHKTSNRTMSIQEETNQTSLEDPNPPTSLRFSVMNASEAQLEGRIFSETVRNLWRTPTPIPPAQHPKPQQQLQQLVPRNQRHSELQREFALVRPQAQKRAGTPVSSSNAAQHQTHHCSFQHERLRMPSRCQYSYVQTINLVQQQQPAHRALAPLCVDVPEFFPKGPGTWPPEDQQQKPLPFYALDNPYQDELFPYKGHATSSIASRKTTVTVYQNTLVPMVPTPIVSAVVWPSPTWAAQRILPTPIQIHHQISPPPSCSTLQPPPQSITIQQPQPPQPPPTLCPTVVHRPIRIQESNTGKPLSASSHHHKSSTTHVSGYQRQNKVTQEHPQRRKSQGVDFNNLILLTKSAMKVRRCQTKGSKKFFAETKAGMSKTDGSSTRWFDKGSQPKRDREYVTLPRLPSSASASRNKVSCSNRERTSTTCTEDEPPPQQPLLSRKRLYRDVLENNVGEDSSFERRYDELERQAMEQYRTSEECLALRYQELEQQALEQYRNAESSESINLDFENPRPSSNSRSDNDDEGSTDDDNRSRCSGFGKCSPAKSLADEKGNELQQRIKILKPESWKPLSASVVHRAASEGNLRPIAVAKRLTAAVSSSNTGRSSGYSSSFRRESKNPARGASGEKIVKTSSLSSLKRRLMPVSPLNFNKSGVNLIKNVSLDPMKAVQTLDKHVAAYYRNTRAIQTGSGDDKVNNAGVWLSDFWS